MRRASKDARDGAAAAGDVPEMRRAVVEALQSTLVLRKAKSAVSESLSATEGAKRTRGLKQGSNGRGGGDEPLATPNVEAIRALLEDLGWAKELRHAVYALVAAAKDGPDDGEPKRRGGRRETEPLASVVSARKQWEASINDELEAIARERHQPLVREREQRGDKADGVLLPPTPSGAPLRFLFDSADPRGNAKSFRGHFERLGRVDAVSASRFLSSSQFRGDVALNLFVRLMFGRAAFSRNVHVEVVLHLFVPRRGPARRDRARRVAEPVRGRRGGAVGRRGRRRLEPLGRREAPAPHGARAEAAGDVPRAPPVEAAARAPRRSRAVPGKPPSEPGPPRRYGLDEKLGDAQADRFSDEWHALGKRCLARGHVPLARRYARRGVPPSLRPQIYRVLLGLPNVEHPQGCSEAEKAYYARLKAHVDKIELVTDELFQMDVQHVADNDYYFPFEEALGNVVGPLAPPDPRGGHLRLPVREAPLRDVARRRQGHVLRRLHPPGRPAHPDLPLLRLKGSGIWFCVLWMLLRPLSRFG